MTADDQADKLAPIEQNLSKSTAPPLDRNPAAVYLASLAPAGRRAMLGRLRVVAEMLGCQDPLAVPWHELRYQHVAAIRRHLQELGQAPATVNAALYALRGVARAAFNLELMTADDLERLRSVKPVRSERLPAGRAVSQGELYAMMGMCAEDETPAGVRDAALIGLMYAAGLRRAEIVSLDLADYTYETGELVVRGKGSKERLLYVDNGAQDALEDWLAVRGPEPGPIFCPINKGGKIQWRRLTDQAIYNMLHKRAGQATVKTCSPHDMRRTFVSDLLEAGADIATVQKLAGHAHIQTTARYDRRGEEAKKKAIGLLHVPWRKRE